MHSSSHTMLKLGAAGNWRRRRDLRNGRVARHKDG